MSLVAESSILCMSLVATCCRRPIGCLILVVLFLKKSTIIRGTFAERDPQLKASYASSPHFIVTTAPAGTWAASRALVAGPFLCESIHASVLQHIKS